MKTVFLGMSGGVDSSLSALLLKEQGYNVVGVYMKNWSHDLPGAHCPWAEDLADAKRIAVRLGLDFYVADYEAEYKQRVVDYMLREFKAGRTPNPDVMCNQEIKFGLFYQEALKNGADYIATGHYAGVNNQTGDLLLAKDQNKDQTYFLYRISQDSLTRTLFPLSNLKKPEVKRLAEQNGLPNARKKESMGVCFVGEVGMKDFLQEFLPTQPGEIRDFDTDSVLGSHDGAIFYTLGQRHGLYLGGGLPYYVVKKDLSRNIVYVSKNLNSATLWTNTLNLGDCTFRNLSRLPVSGEVFVRLRHRAPLLSAHFEMLSAEESSDKNPEFSASTSVKSLNARLSFAEEIKAPAPGQSAVIYSGERPGDVCFGGGIVV